jgi:hypothetical protein
LRRPPLRTLHGALPEALAEGLVVEAGELGEIRGLRSRPGLESRSAVVKAAAVPRAHVLADVAAEDVAAHALAPLLRTRALHLDGEGADAACGVEDVGRDEGARGAGVEARGARAAQVGARRVRGQVEVGDDLAEEEPGAVLGVEEAAVLSPRADPRGRRPGLLGDGAGVHAGPGLEGAGSTCRCPTTRSSMAFITSR